MLARRCSTAGRLVEGRLVTALGVVFALALASLGSSSARAEVTSLGDAPRVFAIQPRPYRLGHEFNLGVGILPTDAFYVGAVAAASYTYHFTDFWGWEIAGGGYSLNFDTSLRSDLLHDYGVEPVGGGGDRVHLFATTGVVAKPLFGKLALFNSRLIQSETFFSLGLGSVLKGKFPRFSTVLGMGLRFWTGEVVSFRFDIRDYLIFMRLVPDHALFFMLSTSFNVHSTSETP
jgi:outer membrane beta-barrel protein